MTDTTAGEGVKLLPCPFCGGEAWLNDYEAKHSDLPPKSRAPQCRSCGVSPGYLPTAKKAIAAWNTRAAQPSAGAQGEADMAFGFGRFVVDTGCYQQKPAVFICPVDQPGEIGASARHLGHDRHKLLPGERVLTFPTVDQAQSVADALVGSPATPAQPDAALSSKSDGVSENAFVNDKPDTGALKPVSEVEMVSHDGGYEQPAPSVWRVEIDGYCADFETEAAANNFRSAIQRFALQQPDTGDSLSANMTLVTDFSDAEVKPDTGDVAALRDPNMVHINMLRGGIAKLTPTQIGHLYRGDEAAEVVREVIRQNPDAALSKPNAPGVAEDGGA